MFITKLRIPLHTFCALALFSAIALDAFALDGKVKKGRYISPLGNFEMELPPMGPGKGKIDDDHDEQGGFVTFLSGMGALSRIDYFQLPPDFGEYVAEGADGPDEAVPDDAYRAFLHGFALPMFKAYSDETQLLHERFVFEGDDRAYFAIVLIPEGAAWIDTKNPDTRLDSHRTLLIFPKGDFMYILSHDGGLMGKLIEQLVENGPKRLETFRELLDFVED